MTETAWSGRDWAIALTDFGLIVTVPSGAINIAAADAASVRVERRWFRWTLCDLGRAPVVLRGITKGDATELERSIRTIALEPAILEAAAWSATVDGALNDARTEQRWISREVVARLDGDRPEPGLLGQILTSGCDTNLTEMQLASVALLDADLESLIAATNEQIVAAEFDSMRTFFESIERSPLTEEQTRAVTCFDNRVQVLAAAGSGKTSVMVARAAYAVKRGFVDPDRILLLAFNKDAASELQDRVSTRFAAAGINSSGLCVSTFHSFGLDLIGRATGEKPRLASWIEHGQDIDTVMRIVDELRDASKSFRYAWDLYRLLFANAPTDLHEDVPDGYDRKSGETGYRTFAGEVVRSHGERMIANFLYMNGVNYVYERPYDIDVSDATHSQYRPDFFYPDIGVWHEHWALDRNGDPPAEFTGYSEGIAWKRDIHATHGTTLVETTWADVMFGDGLARLESELRALGLAFDWNPDRPVSDRWAEPMKHEDLARLVRTFMAHIKSNSSTAEDLEHRLMADFVHLAGYRTRLFLEVYWQIHAEWQRRLVSDRSIDYEDMLVRAAGHLEDGTVDGHFDLVMVDEFQDSSQARARLVRGLVSAPGRYLLAVGDDWQSINRFAGADLSVMTEFEAWFGQSSQLALTTTFRCNQTICDVARNFVTKNPTQFTKSMRSTQSDAGPPVAVILAEDASSALAAYLTELSGAVANGTIPSDHHGEISVDVLGRYRFQRELLPTGMPSNLRVTFRTVHGSKGLEADVIVVPVMTTGRYGFPSMIADDPVLDLAMPRPESFPHAEERRLLYVALTRARRQVTLIAPPTQMSPFVIELLKDRGVSVLGSDETPIEVCTACGEGTMTKRNGKFGAFLGCSRFPACRNTRNLP